MRLQPRNTVLIQYAPFSVSSAMPVPVTTIPERFSGINLIPARSANHSPVTTRFLRSSWRQHV
jgi:hypothetical protein